MAKSKTSEIIVGLDIGTTKIACIVGEVTEDGVDIIGIGTAPSRGLRRASSSTSTRPSQSIQQAVEEAELMAGCEISTVYAGIAGGHINGFNSHGIVAVKDKEVRDADVARVIDAAKAVAIPLDREVIHVLPQEYIDRRPGRHPRAARHGGVRLEAKVHIVTAAVASAQNIIKCANRCGLQVADIVLEPLASAEAVLEDDEKELGVALVDIGGGTTDIACLHRRRDRAHRGDPARRQPRHQRHRHRPAHAARTAEKIKQQVRLRVARSSSTRDDRGASVGGREPRVLPRMTSAQIIEPRVEEIFELVKRELMRSGY